MFMSEVDTLYIPIWFYSNKTVTFIYTKPNWLYIPIWFYSNYIMDSDKLLPIGFTFQSGSIQMLTAV